MKNPENLIKEWLSAANPGLVMQKDLIRLESRVDELDALLKTIEQKLNLQTEKKPRT